MFETFTKNPRDWRFHLGFWLCYSLWYWLVNSLDGTKVSLWELVWVTPMFALACYACYLILEHYVFIGAYWKAALIFLGFFLAYSFLAYLLTYKEAPKWGVRMYNNEVAYTQLAFLQSMLVIVGRYGVFGFAYFLIKRSIYYWQEQVETEKSKQRYEYRSLAGTASLHLMGNLTEEWYVALREVSKELALEIRKAYLLLIYLMESHRIDGPKVITIKQEWEAMERYIELLHSPSFHPEVLKLELDEQLKAYTVPPTTFVSLLENVAKHGKTDDLKKPVLFRVEPITGGYRVLCSNYVEQSSGRTSHGVGLENLRRRLALQYGDKFSLQTQWVGDVFRVELIVKT